MRKLATLLGSLLFFGVVVAGCSDGSTGNNFSAPPPSNNAPAPAPPPPAAGGNNGGGVSASAQLAQIIGKEAADQIDPALQQLIVTALAKDEKDAPLEGF